MRDSRGVDASDLDESVLDSLREIMDETFPVLVQTYLAEAPRLIGAMASALADEDPDRLRQAAHSLKSASANIGASRLAEAAGRLEARGRAGDLSGVRDGLELTKSLFERVRSHLAPFAMP